MVLKNKQYKVGDVVRVCNSALKTYGKVGTVVRSYYNDTVEVKFTDIPTLIYRSENIELVITTDALNYIDQDIEITNKLFNNVKETDDMFVKGDYQVALVKFVQGTNTDKKYAFALFDYEAWVDDMVLVDTSNGYSVAVVTEIHDKASYEALGCSLPTREVICKLNFGAFDERKAKRAKANQLKKDMDKMVKSLQEMAVFELLAEKSPELKAMLEEYKSVAD